MLRWKHILNQKALAARMLEDPTFDPDAPVPIKVEFSDEHISDLENQRCEAMLESLWLSPASPLFISPDEEDTSSSSNENENLSQFAR